MILLPPKINGTPGTPQEIGTGTLAFDTSGRLDSQSGGLQVDATTGTMRPRFATPQAARDWLIEQQQQAHGVLRACGPGRASTSD